MRTIEDMRPISSVTISSNSSTKEANVEDYSICAHYILLHLLAVLAAFISGVFRGASVSL
jgi:hypothetical protein